LDSATVDSGRAGRVGQVDDKVDDEVPENGRRRPNV